MTRVEVGGERSELVAGSATEQALKDGRRRGGELADRTDASLCQSDPRDRPDAPHQLDWEQMEEVDLSLRRHDQQTVGLRHLRGDLREVLGSRHSHRHRQPDLNPHPVPDGGGDAGWRPEQVDRSGDFEKRFVDRDPLDEGRVVAEHLDDLIAEALVFAEVPPDDT